MRRVALTALVVAALAGAGGLLFAWSGLYNVGASAGHWPITTWFLKFALRNSVETHAIGIEVPPLDDPALVFKGMGHYGGGCAPCHGEPGEARGAIARHLLPEPPFLPERVRDWTPAQLFWIVKNGLKYTGMPSWPAPERDDEVWAVVAALLRLPELQAEEYRRLILADTVFAADRVRETARLIAATGPVGESLVACGRCHGMRGAGGGAGAFPRLAGLSEAYLYEVLRAYALGSRPSGIMQPVAAELTEPQMRALAAYYSAISDAPYPPPPPADPQVLQRGAAIAATGIPERRVPPCASCHGPREAQRNPLYPALAGQFPAYIAQQLRLWRAGGFGATPQAQVMDAAAHSLADEQITAVALYYGSLRPEGAE